MAQVDPRFGRRYGADVHTRPNPFDAPAEVVKSSAVAKPAAQPLEFGLRGAREFSSGKNKRESSANDFAEPVPNLPDVTQVNLPPIKGYRVCLIWFCATCGCKSTVVNK